MIRNQKDKEKENTMDTRRLSLNSLKGGLYRELYRGVLWGLLRGLGA